jgi:prepilin peptidase CpaA
MLMNDPTLLSLVVVGLVTIVAAATDLWKFKVYNALTLPTLALGLIVSPFNGGMLPSFLGAAAGFGLLVIFFAMGGVGAGDVKLLTAIGAWLGPTMTFHVFIGMSIAGGLYSLAVLMIRGGVLSTFYEVATLGHRMVTPSLWNRPDAQIHLEVHRADRRRRIVPYASMACVGFFATLILTALERHP